MGTMYNNKTKGNSNGGQFSNVQLMHASAD